MKEAPCASTNSAHAQPDIDQLPATPNVPKSEVGIALLIRRFYDKLAKNSLMASI